MATDIPNKYAIPFVLAFGAMVAMTIAHFIPHAATNTERVAAAAQAAPERVLSPLEQEKAAQWKRYQETMTAAVARDITDPKATPYEIGQRKAFWMVWMKYMHEVGDNDESRQKFFDAARLKLESDGVLK